MLNSYGLLDSFNSDTVKLVHNKKIDDKICKIFDNGKVVFEYLDKSNIFHIDFSICTGYGFVSSEEMMIYTCSNGILSIIDVENNDIIRLSLPNKNFHIFQDTVKLYNGDIYAIIGTHGPITVDRDTLIASTGVEFETVYINNQKYGLFGRYLYKSTVISNNVVENTGRSMIRNSLFGKYQVSDYSIGPNGLTVITTDGQVLNSPDNKNINNTQISVRYNPGIDIRSNINDNIIISERIVDYKSLKMHSVFNTETKSGDIRLTRRFSHSINGNETVFCDIYSDNSAIVHKSNNEYYSQKDHVIIPNVSFSTTSGLADSSFNYPGRVTFSNDGTVVVISRGRLGIVIVKDDTVLYIYDCIGLPATTEIISAKYADDGFLYVAVRDVGYIFRNTIRNDYNSFFDIVVTSQNVVGGELDLNRKVSNIVSSGNDIWFCCKGSHLLLDGITVLSNSGLYRYNSYELTLYKVEAFDTTFNFVDGAVFLSAGSVFLHSSNGIISEYDVYTREKLSQSTTVTTNRRVWDIVKYVDDVLFYVSDFIDINNYTHTLLSDTTSINLGSLTQTGDILSVTEPKLYLPNMSSMVDCGDYIVIIKLISNTVISIYSYHVTGTIFNISKNLPFTLNSDSKLVSYCKNNSIYIEISNKKYSYETPLCLKYDYLTKQLSNYCGCDKSFFDEDDTIICKSTSKTNLRVSEGYISGDNCISDFGAFSVKYDNVQYKATRGLISSYNPSSSFDSYIDRFTGVPVSFNSIVNPKTNYVVTVPIGIGRDDCKVYIARNIVNGSIRFIQEYVTNNKDIIDLDISNIQGYDLLGEPSPGNTRFSNVDYWFVGEICNSAVGIRYKRDISGNKTKKIDFLVYLGIKKHYVIAPTSIDFIDLPNYIYIFDDRHSSFCIYSEQFGQSYIHIDDTQQIIVDIFGRGLTSSYFTKECVSFIDKNYNIDYESYFKNKSNIIRFDSGIHSLRSIYDIAVHYETDDTGSYKNGIYSRKSNDSYYIINSMKTSEVSFIRFLHLDSTYNGIGETIFFIEIDKTYGDFRQLSSSEPILSSFILSINGGTTYSPMIFTQDSINSNIYYCKVTTMGSLILDNVIVSITNQNVITHNTKFRMWVNSIYTGTVSRTAIGPSACSSAVLTINKIDGFSYNNKRRLPSPGLLQKDTIKNIIPNTYSNFTLTINIIPEVSYWYLCDVFDVFSMNNCIVSLQLASHTETHMTVNATVTGAATTVTSRSVNIDRSKPLRIKIRYENSIGISVKIGTENTFTELCNRVGLPIVDYSFGILNYYFGEIDSVYITNNQEDYTLNENVIGDNVFGKATSFIRDHVTGELRVLVSPDSKGNFRDTGIMEYRANDPGSTFSRYKTDKPLNDLKYGELGFCENSAFMLICGRDYLGDIVNIFKRISPNTVPKTYYSKFLKSANDNFIVSCEDNRIKTELYESEV